MSPRDARRELDEMRAFAQEHDAVIALRHDEDIDMFEVCVLRCSAPDESGVRVEIMDAAGGHLLYVVKRDECDKRCADPQPRPDDVNGGVR